MQTLIKLSDLFYYVAKATFVGFLILSFFVDQIMGFHTLAFGSMVFIGLMGIHKLLSMIVFLKLDDEIYAPLTRIMLVILLIGFVITYILVKTNQ